MVFHHYSFSQRRKTSKYELLGGIGPTSFLGDVGGAPGVGTHFLRDLNFSATRYNLYAGIRYKTNPYFGFKAMLAYGMVSGNDALTSEPYRHNRNLNFRSPIVEISAQAEFYFLREKTQTRYRISALKNNRKKNKRTSAYIFVGFGTFFYMPEAKYQGNWVHLRPLHTEGQGLPGGPKQYSNFNVCIPIGLGMKYAINKKWSVGAELSVRKTFTDYIDDVSTTYYDPAKLQQAYGPVSAALSNPSLGLIPGATAPGQERGNPKYQDAYIFLTFNVNYKLFGKRRITRAKF